MTPTMKLRFVERESYSRNGEVFSHPHKEIILQQWWSSNFLFGYETNPSGEWRDVPLEKENT